MKKLFAILTLVIFSAAFILLTPQQVEAKKVVSAEKNSFKQVTKKLDKGGSFYMYMSTERFIKFLEDLIDVIKQAALIDTKKPGKKKEVEVGFNLVSKLLKDSGLFDVSGVGMSSVRMKNGFNHEKTVIHHYKGKGNGLVWRLSGDNPHSFDSQKLLPANTVFASFSDSRLGYFWQWLQQEAAECGIPKIQQGIKMVGPMLKSKGIDLDAILGSLAGKSGIILTLDDSKICKIPVKGLNIEFPDPGLALVIYVKDDTIFNLLKKFIPVPPQVDGDMKKFVGPVVPLPVTLNPMLVQKGNLLILASNGKIVDEILAMKGGLGSNPEFKNLSTNMPARGNSYTFWSSKLFKTITDIQYKAVVKSGKKEDKAMYDALERLNIFPKNLAFYSVRQSTPQGLVYISNNNLPLGGSSILPAMVIGGIVAAIAIPNLLTAMQKGKQKATMGDMVAISRAIELFITDKGHAPKGETIQDIKSQLEPHYIKQLPLKDGWGHEFFYSQGMDGKADAYCIGSGGKDGVFKGWEQSGFYVVKEVKHFNKDIILCGGRFTCGPKIKK